MAQRPAQQRYADLLLGRSVDDFIAERRANDMPYRKIAAELRDATDGEIDVSDVTVRAWWLRQSSESEEVA
jgi:hypothetical protein